MNINRTMTVTQSLHLHQQFRDLVSTFKLVNMDGQTSWSHQTITVDRKAARRMAKRELNAFIRTASLIIERI